MNLSYSSDDLAFRDEVRRFVQQSLPVDVRDKVLEHRHLDRDDHVRWQCILQRRGWGAPGWPARFGGTGWSPLRRLLFDIECGIAGAPRQLPFGLNMIGPVLMKFGSEAQQARFLPRIPTAEDWWCQGYSEPGAGSDLAALKTRAVRRGDHYVVTGQKAWTTYAQHANWMFCLVRTDPEAKQQSGISLLLIDMKTPGISVRPIETLEGMTDVNEVWLDDVKVPVENLVGEENRGWTYAKYLLGHERTGIAGLGICQRELRYLKRLAKAERRYGRPLSDDVRVREKIARIEAEIMALEMLLLRVATDASQHGPGPEASILKIRGSEIQQELSALQLEIAGPNALPFSPEWLTDRFDGWTPAPGYSAGVASFYLEMRKPTIYGGTNEVQKEIIAKAILDL
ncbi:acyl-CoA dehydrogenase family protein [Caballeronia ptereochthonis]|uniref:Acyl-CoA dehydrogenase-like protein n=1 Tax=Caballeronia ptereochthonis TaxID=1777144 RepID=A0A157ZEC0_9BURK|nr:acyl-CoA dehydrogenase family protein [Caballeronia ptereochthonis]SAK43838.1 Acyl-CoA dehydrogenase-like protein [Caballeronia ptereochthonis]